MSDREMLEQIAVKANENGAKLTLLLRVVGAYLGVNLTDDSESPESSQANG